ncbi:uncharacterized protein LOC114542533 [Dendronephthya gigantea]|uniref:uncharacterized protein LOC114542533 n=1 Tax=Dendronephthya gigantea TaxID=151771 RepID=UPI00106A7441|nr:uncharacterized protein LOC114542533 [Dendronephthya gigantea]
MDAQSSGGFRANLSEDDEKKDIQKTPEKDVFSETTHRSSERLRTKSERRNLKLPSRSEILDNIYVDKTIKYESISLQPKRLVNDFVKGANRYVADRNNVFESDDSMSSFIEDSDESPSKKSERSNKRGKTIRSKGRGCMVKKRKIKKRELSSNDESSYLKLDDEIESDDEKIDADSSNTRTRRKSRRLRSIQSSSEEEAEITTNRAGGKTRMRKSDKCGSSSEDDISIKLQPSKRQVSHRFDSSDSDNQPNRKLPMRAKSAKKEKETVLLARLNAKRNKENVERKNMKMNLGNTSHGSMVRLLHDGDTSEEENLSVINSRDFVEYESDEEFIVDDELYSDADDNVAEFFTNF